MTRDFQSITELAGEPISTAQLRNMHHRYRWAANLAGGRDVVEVACGSGQGLGMLLQVARSVVAGDISEPTLARARRHYGDRLELLILDAENLPFDSASKDVIVIFEAIYYLQDARRFVAECRRVLRPGGLLLISTANCDLPDFNPSPFSTRYFGAAALSRLVSEAGFEVALAGYLPVDGASPFQRLLRAAKWLAVRLHLVPKTMAGKRFLRRILQGQLIPMPAELRGDEADFIDPAPISTANADVRHRIIYCTARAGS